MSDSEGANLLPAGSDREAVIQRLSAAFASDHLSLEELERRLDAVYQATTRAELERLTADLPAAAAAPVPVGPPLPAQVFAIFSSNEQGGPLDVPTRLEVRSIFGNVELDLRFANFQPGVTEIEVTAVFGNVEIGLPFDVAVENLGMGVLGNFQCKRARSADPGVTPRCIVRLTGRAVFANVEIEIDDDRPKDRRLRGGGSSSNVPRLPS